MFTFLFILVMDMLSLFLFKVMPVAFGMVLMWVSVLEENEFFSHLFFADCIICRERIPLWFIE